jgi:branched-subunit amino acid transport protein AzlD
MSWLALGVLALGSYAFKALGLVGFASVRPTAAIERLTGLIPPALLAALVVVQTFTVDESLTLDARAVGVAVGCIAVWRRAPFIVVITLAAASTAILRAVS